MPSGTSPASGVADAGRMGVAMGTLLESSGRLKPKGPFAPKYARNPRPVRRAIIPAEVGPPRVPPQRHPSPFSSGCPVTRASLLITAALALRPPRSRRPPSRPIRPCSPSGGSTARAEFAAEPFGPARWLEDGTAYTTLEPSADGTGQDIVRYDVETGTRGRSWWRPRQLVPRGDDGPLEVEDYAWSPDGTMLLIFTNTQPVWRLNTRGDYWVLDRASGQAPEAGRPEAKPSTLMFAKFSPDGGRVGYVRENNLYVEDLASRRDHPAHHRRLADADQRHLRLGVRRGADELLRRRLALEPGRAQHRLLAAQRRLR